MKKTSDITVKDLAKGSASEATLNIDLAPPQELELQPDGGIAGWLQVFACWLLFMNTWSVYRSTFNTLSQHLITPAP
jgi:hypothetical protein